MTTSLSAFSDSCSWCCWHACRQTALQTPRCDLHSYKRMNLLPVSVSVCGVVSNVTLCVLIPQGRLVARIFFTHTHTHTQSGRPHSFTLCLPQYRHTLLFQVRLTLICSQCTLRQCLIYFANAVCCKLTLKLTFSFYCYDELFFKVLRMCVHVCVTDSSPPTSVYLCACYLSARPALMDS